MALSFALPYLGYSFKLDSPNATILIGLYTFILHMLFGFYNLDVYRGSSSDWVPSPIFELSVDTMNSVAIILAIYSFLYMFIASLGLIHGVQTETRIFYFPFLFCTLMEIVFLFYHVFYLIWRYSSYDGETTFMTIVILGFTFCHTYLYAIVYSNYKFLKKIQNPTLIFPPEM